MDNLPYVFTESSLSLHNRYTTVVLRTRQRCELKGSVPHTKRAQRAAGEYRQRRARGRRGGDRASSASSAQLCDWRKRWDEISARVAVPTHAGDAPCTERRSPRTISRLPLPPNSALCSLVKLRSVSTSPMGGR